MRPTAPQARVRARAPLRAAHRASGVALAAALAVAASADCTPRQDAAIPRPTASASATPAPSASATPRPRGDVRCGASRCRAPGERCCHEADKEPCVPDDGSAFCPDHAAQYASIACDDATDCAAGEVCCLETTAEGTQAARCGALPCNTAELCVPDKGGCHEGFRCEPETAEIEGRCALAAPRASCGGLDCKGDTPDCCFQFGGAFAVCAKRGACDRGATVFACSSRADCGGEFCCQHPGGFACAGHCGGRGALCASVDDCPPYAGAAAVGCEPLAGPRELGVKACVYPGATR